jgi:hypothetical protein
LGHDILQLLLLVFEAVVLLVVAFDVGVISVGVVILVGGVILLPLGAVGYEVGGVIALEATPRLPPLLVELSCQQDNLVIGDALILFIRSCSKR